jgi:hypothetical protein
MGTRPGRRRAGRLVRYHRSGGWSTCWATPLGPHHAGRRGCVVRRAGARCRETETGDHLVVEPGLGWGRLASGPTLNVPLNCGFEGSSGMVLMASASPSFGRCRVAAGARGSGDGAGGAGRGGAVGGLPSSRGVPGSARPACWPRCARLPARRGCGWPPAAASSRASLRTGSCVSCSSRCSRPLLRISARSCCRGLPH